MEHLRRSILHYKVTDLKVYYVYRLYQAFSLDGSLQINMLLYELIFPKLTVNFGLLILDKSHDQMQPSHWLKR